MDVNGVALEDGAGFCCTVVDGVEVFCVVVVAWVLIVAGLNIAGICDA